MRRAERIERESYRVEEGRRGRAREETTEGDRAKGRGGRFRRENKEKGERRKGRRRDTTGGERDK